MKKAVIALIGAGNMGSSLLGGLIANGYPPNLLWTSDPAEEKLNILASQFQINTTHDNKEAVSEADVVIFAVKPQALQTVTQELATLIQEKKPLVISIAAGIRENSIQAWLGGNIAIVRAMPNTPALINCGATALYANQYVSQNQHNLAESILRSVSVITWLSNEKWMDIVTALSGSGPAFYFLVMEALQNAAEKCGLPKEAARLLTLQTAYGASRMALESKEDIVTLRQQVTSPAGVTERAIKVLEENKIRELFAAALIAGVKRGEELAELFAKGDAANA